MKCEAFHSEDENAKDACIAEHLHLNGETRSVSFGGNRNRDEVSETNGIEIAE